MPVITLWLNMMIQNINTIMEKENRSWSRESFSSTNMISTRKETNGLKMPELAVKRKDLRNLMNGKNLRTGRNSTLLNFMRMKD